MNHLSYKTEYVDLEQGDQHGNYLAFIFYIDGKKIESEEYNPANCFDILDEDATNQNMIVLAHCGCGCWKCSSLVARVKYPFSNIVEWTVDELRYQHNPHTYTFDKEEYDRVIAQVINEAELEELENKVLKENQFLLRMTPDACVFLFNDNQADEEYGYAYGDDESISIKDENGNDTDITFNIPGLSSWLNKYLWEVLAPCESGEMTIEELNKIFDWKSFHKQGIQIAIEIKKRLPENVFLKYSTSFEDGSRLLKHDIVIKTEQRYIDLVLNKII